jgi:hypothetical protein
MFNIEATLSLRFDRMKFDSILLDEIDSREVPFAATLRCLTAHIKHSLGELFFRNRFLSGVPASYQRH